MDYKPRIGARVQTKPRNWMGRFQKIKYGTVVEYGDQEGFIIVKYDDGEIRGNHFSDVNLSLLETIRRLKDE